MVLALARKTPQTDSEKSDHLLDFLDVGQSPVNLAMKPDGGEIFRSPISTATPSPRLPLAPTKSAASSLIGAHPSHGIVSPSTTPPSGSAISVRTPSASTRSTMASASTPFRSATDPTPWHFPAPAISCSSPTLAPETSPSSAPPATLPRERARSERSSPCSRRQTPQCDCGESVSDAVDPLVTEEVWYYSGGD